MSEDNMRGFTLIELMVVFVILGGVLAFGVPTFLGFTQTNMLRGAASDIASQLRMAREKAIGSGVMQTFHLTYGYLNSDYHIHNGSLVDPKWSLPKGITYYYGTNWNNQFRFTRDGQCMDSGYVMVQNERGDIDTVRVQLSGMIIH
jgi:prepilin-type N-terminal cleavage/methylation domain-containing protein